MANLPGHPQISSGLNGTEVRSRKMGPPAPGITMTPHPCVGDTEERGSGICTLSFQLGFWIPSERLLSRANSEGAERDLGVPGPHLNS